MEEPKKKNHDDDEIVVEEGHEEEDDDDITVGENQSTRIFATKAPLPPSPTQVMSPTTRQNHQYRHHRPKRTKKNHHHKQQQLERNRTNFTMFHFLLTVPKWSVSLFLFLASFSVPLESPTEAIQKPLWRLRSAVDNEAHSYLQCTKRAFNRMQQQLQIMSTQELERVTTLHEQNQHTILDAQTASSACMEATFKARQTLIQWRENGMTIPWMTINDDAPPTCSERNRTEVITFLGEEFRLVENEVSTILDDYIGKSQSSLETLVEYTQARTAYDYEYFVSSRIQPVLSLIEHKPSFDASFLGIETTDLNIDIRSNIDEVKKALENAHIHIDVLLDRVEQFATSIDAFHQAYMDVYQRLEQAGDFIRDIIPLEKPIPAIFNLRNVPLADAMLPPIFQIPNFRHRLPPVSILMDDVTTNLLKLVEDIVQDLEFQASNHLQGILNTFAVDIHDLIVFREYNPPKFVGSQNGIENPFDEIQQLLIHAEQARANAKTTLDKLKEIGSIGGMTNRTNVAGSSFDSTSYDFSEEQTNFAYLRLLSPTFQIPEILQSFMDWLYSNTWILELLVQAVRLWKIEAMYARGSIPDLPEIDYGIGHNNSNNDDENPEHDKNKFTQNVLFLTVVRTFATPWMVLLLIIFPLSIGAITFWYPHVQMGCNLSRNGTFFANNILSPLLINEANALGNGFYVKTELQCQQAQRSLCDTMRQEPDALHRATMEEMQGIQFRHERYLEKLHLVANCIDLSDFDAMIDEACCGLKGYSTLDCPELSTNLICPIDDTKTPPSAFRPLTESTTEPGCQASLEGWELLDARYNCGRFKEVCGRIPCSGVNEDLILSQTIKSDCQVETYVIRSCLFVLVALYHAVVVNIICSLIFKGTRQILWRRLRPDGIKLLTHMNEEGELVTGADKSDRSKRVATAIERFEALGRLQLGLGSVVLLGWFISIYLIQG